MLETGTDLFKRLVQICDRFRSECVIGLTLIQTTNTRPFHAGDLIQFFDQFRSVFYERLNTPFIYGQNDLRFACPYFILGPMVFFPSLLLSFLVTGRALSSNR